MFDRVYSEIPLPDGFSGEMQSKDFDCALGVLLIRGDGRLLIEDCEWQSVPSEEMPNPIFPAMGILRAVNKRWRDLNFHGDFCFYGQEPDGKWHEYLARFTHGLLEKIDVVIRNDICLRTEESIMGHSIPNAETREAMTETDRIMNSRKT